MEARVIETAREALADLEDFLLAPSERRYEQSGDGVSPVRERQPPENADRRRQRSRQVDRFHEDRASIDVRAVALQRVEGGHGGLADRLGRPLDLPPPEEGLEMRPGQRVA